MTTSLLELMKYFGSPIFVGMFISFVAAKSTWFQKQSSDSKAVIIIVTCAFFGLLSFALVTYVPGSVYDQLNPFYNAITAVVVPILASQVWNTYVNNSGNNK